MKISEIIQHLESIAPPGYQEEYDNSGLISGETSVEVYRRFGKPGLYRRTGSGSG